MDSSYYALQKNTNRFIYFVINNEKVKHEFVCVTRKRRYIHDLNSERFPLRILK